MSATTASVLVYRVRQLLADESVSEPKCSLPKILANLDRAYLWVRSELPAKLDYAAAFLALAPNTASYTITETDPQALTGFRLGSSGFEIVKRPLDVFQSYRAGNPVASGAPAVIAFEEAESGVVTAHLWPTPSAIDTVTATVGDGPNITFEGSAGSDLAGVTLNIGAWGAEAMIYFAASLCGGDFMALASDMVAKERERIMGSQTSPEVELVDA